MTIDNSNTCFKVDKYNQSNQTQRKPLYRALAIIVITAVSVSVVCGKKILQYFSTPTPILVPTTQPYTINDPSEKYNKYNELFQKVNDLKACGKVLAKEKAKIEVTLRATQHDFNLLTHKLTNMPRPDTFTSPGNYIQELYKFFRPSKVVFDHSSRELKTLSSKNKAMVFKYIFQASQKKHDELLEDQRELLDTLHTYNDQINAQDQELNGLYYAIHQLQHK